MHAFGIALLCLFPSDARTPHFQCALSARQRRRLNRITNIPTPCNRTTHIFFLLVSQNVTQSRLFNFFISSCCPRWQCKRHNFDTFCSQRMMAPVLKLLLAAKLISVSVAFSAIAPTATTTYDALKSAPLVRASDAKPIALPTLWRSNTPFGIADEFAVCAFLRHFG